MTTDQYYSTGQTPLISDIVSFTGWYLLWRLFDGSFMRVVDQGYFKSGKPYVTVEWIREDGGSISTIATLWNPENFVLVRREMKDVKEKD